MITTSGEPCDSADGAYAASWISGVTRDTANPSDVLVSFNNYCVMGNLDYLAEGYGLAEYDPATNTLDSEATVFSDTSGSALGSQELLGSPVVSGGYLYLFGSYCSEIYDATCISNTGNAVYLARVSANPLVDGIASFGSAEGIGLADLSIFGSTGYGINCTTPNSDGKADGWKASRILIQRTGESGWFDVPSDTTAVDVHVQNTNGDGFDTSSGPGYESGTIDSRLGTAVLAGGSVIVTNPWSPRIAGSSCPTRWRAAHPDSSTCRAVRPGASRSAPRPRPTPPGSPG